MPPAGSSAAKRRAASLGRERVFKKLQTETTYFRALGIETLRGSEARKDFDRVKVEKAPTPQQVSAKKQAAAAKKLAAEAKKVAKKNATKAKKQGKTVPSVPATGT